MDFEKAYKEALERARKLRNEAVANEYTSDIEDYDTIFPELAESEDERMFRELMERFDVWGVTLEYKTEVMAWIRGLIEQKEPLTPEEKMNHPLYLEGFDVGKKVGEVTSKPAESTCQSFRDALFDCIAETVVTYIDDYTPDSRGDLIEGQTERWAERLYAIANASQTDANENANAEWSEGDEKMLASFLHKVEVCDLLTNKEIMWAKHRLKSLRPRPHWKPSKEQMQMLDEVIVLLKNLRRDIHSV